MSRPRWAEHLAVTQLEQAKPVPVGNWKGFYWYLGYLWAIPIWLDVGITLYAFLRFPGQVTETGPFFGILYRISPGLFSFGAVMMMALPFFAVHVLGRNVRWQYRPWLVLFLAVMIGYHWWDNLQGFTHNLAELGKLS